MVCVETIVRGRSISLPTVLCILFAAGRQLRYYICWSAGGAAPDIGADGLPGHT